MCSKRQDIIFSYSLTGVAESIHGLRHLPSMWLTPVWTPAPYVVSGAPPGVTPENKARSVLWDHWMWSPIHTFIGGGGKGLVSGYGTSQALWYWGIIWAILMVLLGSSIRPGSVQGLLGLYSVMLRGPCGAWDGTLPSVLLLCSSYSVSNWAPVVSTSWLLKIVLHIGALMFLKYVFYPYFFG